MGDNNGVFVRYVSRREFLRKLGLAAASLPAAHMLADHSLAQTPEPVPTVTPVPPPELTAQAQAVGGQLDFYSWEGYDFLDATKKWREEHGVDLKSAYIASSDDTPAKILSPAGKGVDVITYFYAYYQTWTELGMFTEFSAEEVPNIKTMYPFFQQGEYWRTPRGSYFGVPLTWLTYVINYRSDLIERPSKWSDLLDAKFKNKLAIVEDPGANIIVAATILGIKTDTMTRKELEEIKKFLLGLKANAKTIAPSYGDLSNLLVSGEAVATFVGWAALNVWAAKDGVPVDSVEPEDGIVISIDSYAIPPTCDNRPTALAWCNLMLSPEVQLSVVNDLLTATVRPDVVPMIQDEKVRNLYAYDTFEAFLQEHKLNMFPPMETTGDRVSYADWMKMWEEVKAE